MMRILLQWMLSALSLMMVAKLLPGFHIKDFGSALGVAAVYGIFHVVLYPVLLFVAFIPVLLSFGLFIFVINGLMLLLTASLSGGRLMIDGFWWAVLGGIIMGIVGLVLESVLGLRDQKDAVITKDNSKRDDSRRTM